MYKYHGYGKQVLETPNAAVGGCVFVRVSVYLFARLALGKDLSHLL